MSSIKLHIISLSLLIAFNLINANYFDTINNNNNNNDNQMSSNILKQQMQQLQQNHQYQQQLQLNRPCPYNCNCNYNIIYCNDLIEKCDECIYWSQIDFNRITSLKVESFKNYHFARNKLTNIFIYNLINDTIYANSFKDFYVPVNSHVEITFHYNSFIKFREFSLNGIYIDLNSTLVINFPFTTQVIFMKNSFNEIFMKDFNSKFVIRILKSFIVRFGDLMQVPSPPAFNMDTVSDTKLNFDSLMSKTSKNSVITSKSDVKTWNLSNGQFVIDIKSTRSVRFEEDFFKNFNLNNNTKLYIDLELIEKLIFHQNTFNNINLYKKSQIIIYLKQINYLNLKEYTFNTINLYKQSAIRVYLNELTSSICLNPNLFTNINLLDEYTYLNLTISNSKNIVFTQKLFTNISMINDKNSKLVFSIYNLPSILFKNYHKQIQNERMGYLLPINEHLKSIDIYFNSFDSNTGGPSAIVDTNDGNTGKFSSKLNTFDENIDEDSDVDYDFNDNFYLIQKQFYLYNISIESNTFYNITSNNYNDDHNILFLIDNFNTLLIDNFIINNQLNNKQNNSSIINIKYLLNIKNFISDKNSFAYLNKIFIKFFKEPKLIKLSYDLLKIANNGIKFAFKKSQRQTKQQMTLITKSPYETNENVILKNNSTRIICDVNEWKAKNNLLTPNKSFKLCTCEHLNEILVSASNNSNQKPPQPCILANEYSLNSCKIKFDLHCYNTFIINSNETRKFIVKNKIDLVYDYDLSNGVVKFWQICSKLRNYKKEVDNEQEQLDLQTIQNTYFFYTFNDNDSFISDGLSSSSLLNISDTMNKDENLNTNNIGKLIGIVVISFIVGIILFMIIINIIQYKLRSDQFDDYDSSDVNNTWSWKRTFSVQSLKKTISLSSLKRSKKDSIKISTKLNGNANNTSTPAATTPVTNNKLIENSLNVDYINFEISTANNSEDEENDDDDDIEYYAKCKKDSYHSNSKSNGRLMKDEDIELDQLHSNHDGENNDDDDDNDGEDDDETEVDKYQLSSENDSNYPRDTTSNETDDAKMSDKESSEKEKLVDIKYKSIDNNIHHQIRRTNEDLGYYSHE